MKVSQLRKYFLFSVALVAGRADAETIFWSSALQKTNFTSADQAMDGTFQFQLGSFSGGFVPTAANITRWATYWDSVDVATYEPAVVTRAFEGEFTPMGNSAPFSIGAKAYVWGRSAGGAKDEWIFRRAKQEVDAILTKDEDFLRLVQKHGPPPSIIWVTVGNTSNRRMKELLTDRLPRTLQLIKEGNAVVEIAG